MIILDNEGHDPQGVGNAPRRPAPMKPITMQDIRLVAGEGKLPAWAVLDAVNVILRQRGLVA